MKSNGMFALILFASVCAWADPAATVIAIATSKPNFDNAFTTCFLIEISSTNRLWFSVDKVVHHDDILFANIIRSGHDVAAHDSHAGDSRVWEGNAEEGE